MPQLSPPELLNWRPQNYCTKWMQRLLAQVDSKRKFAQGHPCLRAIFRRIPAPLFLADDLSDFLCLQHLIDKRYYTWAVALGICITLPYVCITIMFAVDQRKYRSFEDAFGVAPYAPVLIFYAYKLRMKSLFCSLTHSEEYLNKIFDLAHANLESTPWIACQIGMLAWAYYSGTKTLVDERLLVISVLLSCYSINSFILYIRKQSTLVCEGSWSRFVQFLFQLGKGTGVVPLPIMRDILEERDLVITEDLSYLDYKGLRSIGRAIGFSEALRSVTFHNCNFHLSKAFEEESWKEFTDRFCGNRSHLKTVSFQPKLEIEEDGWWFFESAMYLECVKNGEEILFEAKEERSDLWKAVRNDDARTILQVVDRVYRKDAEVCSDEENIHFSLAETLQAVECATLAARLDHFHVLAALLSKNDVLKLDMDYLLVWSAYDAAEMSVELLLHQRADLLAKKQLGVWEGDALNASSQRYNNLTDAPRLEIMQRLVTGIVA